MPAPKVFRCQCVCRAGRPLKGTGFLKVSGCHRRHIFRRLQDAPVGLSFNTRGWGLWEEKPLTHPGSRERPGEADDT